MYLKDVTKDTFVLLQAELTAERAKKWIENLDATHVIILRTEPKDSYYLYPKDEALNILTAAEQNLSVSDAFGLRERDATPELDCYTDTSEAPAKTIVTDEGRLVGFYEAGRTTRGVAKGVTIGGKDTEQARSLQVDFPEKVQLNDTVSLLVAISKDDERSAGMPLAVKSGEVVDIVVQPKDGFSLQGSADGQITITDEEILPLQFKLTATELGQGKILVYAFRNGQSLGVVKVVATVHEEAARGPIYNNRSEQGIGQIRVQQPDLSMVIFEELSHGNPAFTIRLTSADGSFNLKKFGPVELKLSSLEYFNEMFKDIEQFPYDNDRDIAKAKQRMEAKGTFLFESLIPNDLQAILWSRKDQMKTVLVQSEEPWIPWELCRLVGKKDGKIVEGPFLCEGFELTRWLPEQSRKLNLSLKNIALVVPKDSNLPYAEDERKLIQGFENGRKVTRIEAKFQEVREALASGEYDGWHFSGHGGLRNQVNPDRAKMILQDGDTLTPEDLSGSVSNLGVASPFIFLNACQIGQAGMSLTDIGGWASRFLKAGAAGFIGAYWSVFDQPAYTFAKEFYKHLLSGATVGKAAKEARLEIKKLEDPTWLAYTVFADPMAKVA